MIIHKYERGLTINKISISNSSVKLPKKYAGKPVSFIFGVKQGHVNVKLQEGYGENAYRVSRTGHVSAPNVMKNFNTLFEGSKILVSHGEHFTKPGVYVNTRKRSSV